jgi:hypothetical protein
MTKDAALDKAISVLTAIAAGKSFDSLEYFQTLTELQQARINTITLADVTRSLDAMGFDAYVEDTGGNLEIIRVNDSDGDYYLIDNHSTEWNFTAHREDDSLYQSERLGVTFGDDNFAIAQAISKAINPNSGRR